MAKHRLHCDRCGKRLKEWEMESGPYKGQVMDLCSECYWALIRGKGDK